MTELKTLKDIMEKVNSTNREIINVCFAEDLREEAITTLQLSDYDLWELFCKEDESVEPIRRYIKHFFNITPEDLK